MSTALAIASVSAVLVDLLNNGLIDHDVATSLGAVTVSALPPDRITTGGPNPPTQLNLFLYRATPNAAWRNIGLPSRNGNGDLIGDHALALDLHYLLSAYGAADFHGEILLGHGMQILHETPALSREAVRRSLAPPSPVAPNSALPSNLRALFNSGLADQFEQIRITPESLSTEEISKLWSAFQTNYRPTAAYVATVVLIESSRRPRASLPVLTRGLRVLPLEQPDIDVIRVEDPSVSPPVSNGPVLADSVLLIRGRQLSGEDTVVLVDGRQAVPLEIREDLIRTPLPPGTTAGVHGVQVVHRLQLGSPPVPHRWVESNVEAIVVRPVVQSMAVANPVDQGGGIFAADLDVTLNPPVEERQRVVLLLNEAVETPVGSPRSFSFVAPPRSPSSPPAPSSTIRIPIRNVPSGPYLVRVQVDGAESPLTTDAQGVFTGPQRDIP
jgi:hypothetical protein